MKLTKPIVPNLALQQLREALQLTQEGFASLIDFSRAFIQAIELGQREPSPDFVRTVVLHTGVWPECVRWKWSEAVDFDGEPYTSDTYSRFLATQSEEVEAADIDALLAPAKGLLETAAKFGKAKIAAHFFCTALQDAAFDVLRLNRGIEDAVRGRGQPVGKLTVGFLREHPEFATAAGFVDDGTRSSDEEIVLASQGDEKWSVSKLFPKTLAPDRDQIYRKHLRRVKA